MGGGLRFGSDQVKHFYDSEKENVKLEGYICCTNSREIPFNIYHSADDKLMIFFPEIDFGISCKLSLRRQFV